MLDILFQKNSRVRIGDSFKIESSRYQQPKICIIKNPEGKVMIKKDLERCSYTIPNVGESDEGVWTIEYAVDGINTFLKEKINITAYYGIENHSKFYNQNFS